MTRSRQRGPYAHNHLGYVSPLSTGGHPAPPFTKSECALKVVCVASGERLGQFVTVENMSEQEFAGQVRYWLSLVLHGQFLTDAYAEVCAGIGAWDDYARWYVLLEVSARLKRFAIVHKTQPVVLFVEEDTHPKSEVA